MSGLNNHQKRGVKRQTTLFHNNAVKKMILDKKKKKVYVDIDEEEKVLMTKKTVRKALECVCVGCERAFSNQQGLTSHKVQ